MGVKVKICGLSRIEDIDYVNDMLPDYIGFVFAKKSKRYLDYDMAAKLKSRLDKSIKAVGVFVDEKCNEVASAYDRRIIDVIQLHGSEDNDYIRNLRAITSAKIIKAFSVESEADIDLANASLADMVLLDNKNAGSGKCFDWTLVSQMKREFMLAGGISAKNVREAKSMDMLYGIDASSSVETDGKKDEKKIKQLIEAVRCL